MTPDETDPDVAALEADLNRGDNLEWHVWRGDNGGTGILHAWLIEPVVSPPVILADRTRAGLAYRCAEFEAVWAQDSFTDDSCGKARAAAEGLDT